MQSMSFTVDDRTFELKHQWNSISKKFKGAPPSYYFSVSPHPEQALFISSTFLGFMVCEDYRVFDSLSEVSTEKMQVTSLDLSPGNVPEAVVSFTRGNILLLNALERRRGRVAWFNTSKNMYSSKIPIMVKWANADTFVVVFGDSNVWFFDRAFSDEDERIVAYIKQKLSEKRPEIFHVVSCNSDKNPLEAWNFNLGKINDIKFHKKMMCLAFASGHLGVFAFADHEHLLTFRTYFGGVRCIDLDLNGSLIAAGGEDDAVSIWNIPDKQLVARGQAHNNWVSDLSFDKKVPNLLFSIGLDCKMFIWKILVESLESQNVGKLIEYPARQYIPFIEPLTRFEVVCEPLTSLKVKENLLFIEDSNGIIWMWEARQD